MRSVSLNQRLPSDPATIDPGTVVTPLNSVKLPPGVMRPIVNPSDFVNQRLPSHPCATPGHTCVPESACSVTVPVVLMLAMPAVTACSVNHNMLPGPAVMSPIVDAVMPDVNGVTTPAVVIRATTAVVSGHDNEPPPTDSVNQRLPSEPDARCPGHGASNS